VTTSDTIKIAAAIALLGFAGFLVMKFVRQGDGIAEKAFFYDLSEQKIFTAPRTAVPPIRGVNDSQEDGMRAVVISVTGNPADKASRKVAYLEKYSPELKRQMETAQATGASPQMGRIEALGHRFVSRAEGTQWFPMNSPEAEQIVTEWATPGPGGVTPVVCAP
jgi:hypothetical protein